MGQFERNFVMLGWQLGDNIKRVGEEEQLIPEDYISCPMDYT